MDVPRTHLCFSAHFLSAVIVFTPRNVVGYVQMVAACSKSAVVLIPHFGFLFLGVVCSDVPFFACWLAGFCVCIAAGVDVLCIAEFLGI